MCLAEVSLSGRTEREQKWRPVSRNRNRGAWLSALLAQGLDEGNTAIDKINQYTVNYCEAVKQYIAGDWKTVRPCNGHAWLHC